MAHAALIDDLCDRLIAGFIQENKNGTKYRHFKDQAVKKCRDRRDARTNQFDVDARYNGLIEKFEILNREKQASILQADLDALPRESKFLPEILALLLELSDRPLQSEWKEPIEARQIQVAEKSLTWTEIVADDPLDEPGLWDDVERGYHSSGDDADESASDSEGSLHTAETSIEETVEAIAGHHIISVELKEIADEWSGNGSKIAPVTELFVIREILSMLQGLPTHLFATNSDGRVSVPKLWSISTLEQSTLLHCIKQCADIGSSLNFIRAWVKGNLRTAFEQSCQSAVRKALRQVDIEFAQTEEKYLAEHIPHTTISLLDLCLRIEQMCWPITNLSNDVKSIHTYSDYSPFALLDNLYDSTCKANASGDNSSYRLLLDVFTAGFSTYMITSAHWLSSGFVSGKNGNFFVQEGVVLCELGDIWRSRYSLRKFPDGTPFAPQCVAKFVQRIFAIGKSQALLNCLDSEATAADPVDDHQSQPFTHGEANFDTRLLPFAQVLDLGIERWITATASDCSLVLHNRLLDEHRLLQIQSLIENSFCGIDGVLFQDFTDSLFSLLHRGHQRMKDQFIITKLAQTTLGSATGTDFERFSVSFREDRDSSGSDRVRTSSIRQLAYLNLEYTVPWPIQNITGWSTPKTHPQIFRLLLQIRRAKHLLTDVIESSFASLRSTKINARTAQALKARHRLLWFVDTVHTHITQTCQTLGISVREAMEVAVDIDSMVKAWSHYETELETNMLLAPRLSALAQSIQDVLEICEAVSVEWNLIARANKSSLEADDEEIHLQAELSGPGTAHSRSLARLMKDMDTLLSFFVAGLRGIARARASSALDMLADRLEWGNSTT